MTAIEFESVSSRAICGYVNGAVSVYEISKVGSSNKVELVLKIQYSDDRIITIKQFGKTLVILRQQAVTQFDLSGRKEVVSRENKKGFGLLDIISDEILLGAIYDPLMNDPINNESECKFYCLQTI